MALEFLECKIMRSESGSWFEIFCAVCIDRRYSHDVAPILRVGLRADLAESAIQYRTRSRHSSSQHSGRSRSRWVVFDWDFEFGRGDKRFRDPGEEMIFCDHHHRFEITTDDVRDAVLNAAKEGAAFGVIAPSGDGRIAERRYEREEAERVAQEETAAWMKKQAPVLARQLTEPFTSHLTRRVQQDLDPVLQPYRQRMAALGEQMRAHIEARR